MASIIQWTCDGCGDTGATAGFTKRPGNWKEVVIAVSCQEGYGLNSLSRTVDLCIPCQTELRDRLDFVKRRLNVPQERS